MAKDGDREDKERGCSLFSEEGREVDEDGSFLGDSGGRLGADLFMTPNMFAATSSTVWWEFMDFVVLAVNMRCRVLLLLLRRR